ncbi:MAG TPA: hypothetical protein VL989_04000 [Candidatus Sulfotelmatobacter sp.]|nr:hypothetical protein [Candidatus Sulfotelmatobacter sp.]
MSNKTKIEKTTLEKMSQLSTQLGVLLMSVATTVGMIEINNHVKTQVLTPARAVVSSENQVEENYNSSNLVKDRDDVAPHFISYSETQRTPSRSGRVN